MELKRYRVTLTQLIHYEVEEETLDEKTAVANAIEWVKDGNIRPLNPNAEATVAKVELVE